jgi:5-methylcytosine-specific restriction endonuclease McrA
MREYERERSRRRRADPDRGQRVAIYHKKKWLTTRKKVLASDPICRVCGQRLSTEVDHVVPLAQGGDPWDLDGLQGICGPCHWEKSARESRAA